MAYKWHSVWYLSWHACWHICWHSIWHLFWHSFWHLFWHPIWILLRDLCSRFIRHHFWNSIWHLFRHSFWHVLTFDLAVFLAFYLASIPTSFPGILYGTCSEIRLGSLSGILSGIYSDILSSILCCILSGILSDISSDSLSDILCNILRSHLRSGCARWDWHLLAVEREETVETFLIGSPPKYPEINILSPRGPRKNGLKCSQCLSKRFKFQLVTQL